MEWFFVAVLAVLLFGTSLLCLAALLGRSRIQRRHRVDPAVPTEAPLSWLIDPRTPARLHRRLARVGTSTTTVVDDHRPRARRRLRRKPPEPSLLATTAVELRAQAVLLDQQVARLSVLAPKARRQPLLELHRAVGDVEAAGARLVALSTQARAPRGLDTDDRSLDDVTARIDRLAHAHQELLALDVDNRLIETPLPAPPLVDPAARRPPPPAAPPEARTWPPTPPTAPPAGRR